MLISTVAKQWKNLSTEDKQMWKERAIATHVVDKGSSKEKTFEERPQEADDEPIENSEWADHIESSENEDDEEEDAAPPARSRTRRS